MPSTLARDCTLALPALREPDSIPGRLTMTRSRSLSRLPLCLDLANAIALDDRPSPRAQGVRR